MGLDQPQPMSAQPNSPHSDILKKFKQQILALGVLWIILGLLNSGAGIAIIVLGGTQLQGGQQFAPDPTQVAVFTVLGVISAIFGLTWLVVGVASLMKQIWAVWVGTVLSGIGIALSLLNLNCCLLLLLIATLFQGIRVIGFAGQLKKAGVPLTS